MKAESGKQIIMKENNDSAYRSSAPIFIENDGPWLKKCSNLSSVAQ